MRKKVFGSIFSIKDVYVIRRYLKDILRNQKRPAVDFKNNLEDV